MKEIVLKEMKLELMTIEEAAKFLNVKVSKIRREVFRKTIKHFKLGALVRFNKTDLIQWLDSKTVYPRTLALN